MTQPVNSSIKEFVQSEVRKITAEHEKMISGWENVDFTDENITHLYNLFKTCNKQEIRLFEENNFLEEKDKVNNLITKKLERGKPFDNPIENTGKQNLNETTTKTKGKATEKANKKRNSSVKNSSDSETSSPKEIEYHNKSGKTADETEKSKKLGAKEIVQESNPVYPVEEKPEAVSTPETNQKQLTSENTSSEAVSSAPTETPSVPEKSDTFPKETVTVSKGKSTKKANKKKNSTARNCYSKPPSSKEIECDNKIPNEETADKIEIGKSKHHEANQTVQGPKPVVKEPIKLPNQEQPTNEVGTTNGTMETVNVSMETVPVHTETLAGPTKAMPVSIDEATALADMLPDLTEISLPPQIEECSKRSKNPFDNEHLFIEPLISNTSNTKERENDDEFAMRLGHQYMSQESHALKSNLHRLATDISTEEQNIRSRMVPGEPTKIDKYVLDDFISRANVVLKETEAVTVRKIAEAETKKFLTSLKVPTGAALETISNELMQDIWPKSNRWRSFSRSKIIDAPVDKIDSKTKRKQEEQVEREVRTAIKSAGESLNKKQIGQIRKAAIVYRDFDDQEQKELEYRSNHTLKLVELVSAYEATNQLDDLILMRLAIAFCTKRRDYFLKYRPPNFMQFSYMYIYLLEKINSKTASICACLNYQITVSRDFNELEELMLNLFHEDYFLEDN